MNVKTTSKRYPDSVNVKPCSVIWTITVNLLSSKDTYPSTSILLKWMGLLSVLKNSLLAEALENLDGKKRDVILRYWLWI